MTGPTRTRPGRPYPLGATWDGAGVNFALFSEHATQVELDAVACRHATGDETSAGFQTFEAGLPNRGADVLQDDVDPFTARKGAHTLQNVVTGVIDCLFSP